MGIHTSEPLARQRRGWKLLRVCGIVAGLAILFFFACCKGAKKGGYTPEYTTEPTNQPNILIFGVHPLYNPQRLQETYGPLIDHLNRHLVGAKIELEASRSYETFEQKLYGRHFHFALPNPYQTINSLKHGYRVFGKMGGMINFEASSWSEKTAASTQWPT